ncbi:hypothetical protein [Pilibacter termitis]|uniref:hypothetical protein n=1 Tax=Pilibacter termitis TaxID=263852 RepID=UPI001184A2C1|nr:hypothetical protein [Pilibacter termitis]
MNFREKEVSFTKISPFQTLIVNNVYKPFTFLYTFIQTRKAERGGLKFATVNHVVYLLETLVSSDVVNSCQTSAPRS